MEARRLRRADSDDEDYVIRKKPRLSKSPTPIEVDGDGVIYTYSKNEKID